MDKLDIYLWNYIVQFLSIKDISSILRINGYFYSLFDNYQNIWTTMLNKFDDNEYVLVDDLPVKDNVIFIIGLNKVRKIIKFNRTNDELLNLNELRRKDSEIKVIPKELGNLIKLTY